jgi:hypothetical protein
VVEMSVHYLIIGDRRYSLHHLVGAGEQHWRDLQTKPFRRRDVYDQFKLCRQLDWQIARLRTFDTARSAQHTASDSNQRHVEILSAASAGVDVSVVYQLVDTANVPWPTSIALAAGFPRSGSAWLGRSPLQPRYFSHACAHLSRVLFPIRPWEEGEVLVLAGFSFWLSVKRKPRACRGFQGDPIPKLR